MNLQSITSDGKKLHSARALYIFSEPVNLAVALVRYIHSVASVLNQWPTYSWEYKGPLCGSSATNMLLTSLAVRNRSCIYPQENVIDLHLGVISRAAFHGQFGDGSHTPLTVNNCKTTVKLPAADVLELMKVCAELKSLWEWVYMCIVGGVLEYFRDE